MAIATQDILAVKRKVFNYLVGGTKGNPWAERQFKEFWSWYSQHAANPDMQVVFFENLGADAVVADAACKVYAIVLKKRGTSTNAFYNVFDDATNDATEGDKRITVGLVTALERALVFYRDGLAMAAGVVHGSYTAAAGVNGTTPSTSGDGPDGFVIIGKP